MKNSCGKLKLLLIISHVLVDALFLLCLMLQMDVKYLGFYVYVEAG